MNRLILASLGALFSCSCGGLLGGENSYRATVGGQSASSGGNPSAGSFAAGGAGVMPAGTNIGGSSAAGACPTGGATSDDSAYCSAGILCDQSSGCESTSFGADIRNVNMLLVVDGSTFMSNQASPTDTATRWTALKPALQSTLKAVAKDINFGLEIFPFSESGLGSNIMDPSDTCSMPAGAAAIQADIQPGLDSVNAILQRLNAHVPSGNAPLSAALDSAYEYYTEGLGRCLTGSRSVLLVTTGAANCNDALTCDSSSCIAELESSCPPYISYPCCFYSGFLCSDESAVVEKIKRLASAGIKTFVAGLPNSEAERAMLNAYATAGDMVNPGGSQGELFYRMNMGDDAGANDLLTAWSTITTQLIHTCDFQLDKTPPDRSLLFVAVDCVMIPQDTTGTPDAVGDGWVLDTSQTPAHVVLGGKYCEAIQTVGTVHVNIGWSCPDLY